MGRLDGKIALITGATSGIGRACAELFAQEGATVICVGRNEKKGREVINNISRLCLGNKSEFYLCDVSCTKNIASLYDYVRTKYNRLDILLNNAGVLITKNLQELDDDDWDKVYNTNLKSVVNMTKYFVDLITESHGNILNNASASGLESYTTGKRAYLYATSKSAIIKFTKLCALNYAENIRVNCLCPGIIDTPIYTNKDYARFDGIPMGRVGTACEVAKAAVFLASDEASYITGTTLVVDGGASLK